MVRKIEPRDVPLSRVELEKKANKITQLGVQCVFRPDAHMAFPEFKTHSFQVRKPEKRVVQVRRRTFG